MSALLRFAFVAVIVFGAANAKADRIRVAVQKTGTLAWELEVIKRHGIDRKLDLIIETKTRKYQRTDAVSLLNPSPENRNDALVWTYLSDRLDIDPDQHLTSVRLRRAARHLAGQTEMPISGLAPDEEDLARVMTDLVQLAGRAGEVTPERLEQQRLLLERARLERAIRRARDEGGLGVSELKREHEQVQGEIWALGAQIDQAV